MKTKNNFFLLMLVFTVVFVAGCTSSNQGGSSNAIIIKSFGPELNEIEPTDDVSLTALIENTGGSKATGINAQLLGLTDEWRIDPGRVVTVRDLLPPDPSRKLQGDSEELVWFLTPPSAKKVPLDYDMELRVFFNYQTFSENLLRVATRAYIDSFPTEQKQAERDKLGVTTSVPSSGPISVTIVTRSKILDQASDTMSIIVDIQNVGSGKPENDEIGIILRSAGRDLQCTGTTGGRVRLAEGKSRQLRCTVDIGGVVDRGWEQVPISIELSYTYWVSSVSNIKVLGAEIT